MAFSPISLAGISNAVMDVSRNSPVECPVRLTNYGYSMIWLIIPIMFMGITFMLTTYRISMMTGMPIIHAAVNIMGNGPQAL